MAGHERREAVAAAERTRRAGRARPARERRKLTVGDDLAARHFAEGAGAVAVEPVVELELDVCEVVRFAGEERLEPSAEWGFVAVRIDSGRTGAGPRQLRPDDALTFEPELPHPEARRGIPNEGRLHHLDLVYRPAAMARRSVIHIYAPILGYVYVSLGVIALALASDHPQAADAVFVGAAFALLWFLGSLHARIIRFEPDGFFASVVVLGGASLLAIQAVALASRNALVAAPGAACAAAVIISSSLAALSARKITRWFGRLGIAGGLAVLAVGIAEAAAKLDVCRAQTLWASTLGFMIWVLVTATFLVRS